MATLEERGDEAFFEVGTDVKSLRTAVGVIANLDTTATDLVEAINEVLDAVGTGGAVAFDDLTDVVLTGPTTGHVVRHNGTNWVNVLGTTFFEVAGAAAAAQAAAIAASQPLDADLTSIAALSTTAYGRAFLALADQAALMALVQAASETVAGKAEVATTAEVTTATDDARFVTPLKLAGRITSLIDTNVALGASNTVVPSQAAVKAYADGLIAAANGMVFKGVIDASTNPNYPAASAGDLYKISVAGKIGGASGPNVEIGDLILCLTDSTPSGTHAAQGSNWNISQVNIDGAVTGPTSATSGNLPSFNGTTGKIIQDSGFTPSNSAIGAGSATILPTSAQVVAYSQPIDADLTAIAAVASQTAYGRAFLALANQAALMALLSAASETVAGVAEIATTAEVTTGTDDTRIVTPLKWAQRFTALIGDPDNSFLTTYQTARDA